MKTVNDGFRELYAAAALVNGVRDDKHNDFDSSINMKPEALKLKLEKFNSVLMRNLDRARNTKALLKQLF